MITPSLEDQYFGKLLEKAFEEALAEQGSIPTAYIKAARIIRAATFIDEREELAKTLARSHGWIIGSNEKAPKEWLAVAETAQALGAKLK